MATHALPSVPDPPYLQDAWLRALYAYWLELAAAEGGLPRLVSFDPIRMSGLLAGIWIFEIDPATRRFRMQLAGESINAIYGRNIGGKYVDEIFNSLDLPVVVQRYRRALREPAIFRAFGNVYATAGRYCPGERLGLPMIGRSGCTDTLLGATTYGGEIQSHQIHSVTGDVAAFHRVEVCNHRPVDHAQG